eukprot:snap_masked-scaffold_5-processed-gene-5.37-mRNA-1 protein AED:1.00 eAED:1.00 QI:0/-1/0/0/-1/1/1/0/641
MVLGNVETRKSLYDLYIPPSEIKCKCPGSESLFLCDICFHQDSQLCLGSGSFAVAYYALWMGTPVAVKHFKNEKSNRKRTQSMKSSFMRELAILKRVRHPNIVCLYGYSTQDIYLVLEVARRGCLADFIAHNRLKNFTERVWPVHSRISLELVSAINFLHQRDIVHGDLKSFNILLDTSYTIKIADFGTSFVLNDPEHSQALEDSDLPVVEDSSVSPIAKTKDEKLPLSVAWASPGRLKGEGPSKAADIFATGVVLWELASLQLPYNTFQGSAQKLAAKIVHAKLRPDLSRIDGFKVPNAYIKCVISCWKDGETQNHLAQPNEEGKLVTTLEKIYPKILQVCTAWKCIKCGLWNLRVEVQCRSCEFDPFAPNDLFKKDASKSGVATETTDSLPSNLNFLLGKETKPSRAVSSYGSSFLSSRLTNNSDPTQGFGTKQLHSSNDVGSFKGRSNGCANGSEKVRSVSFQDERKNCSSDNCCSNNDSDQSELGKGCSQKKREENYPVDPVSKNYEIYNSVEASTSAPKNETYPVHDATAANTRWNRNISDVVNLDTSTATKKKNFEYSKFKGSCVVKDCSSCSFKDACGLSIHKNLHNAAGKAAEKEQSLEDVQAGSDLTWECDLCFAQNPLEDTECSSCFCSRP